MSEYSEILKKGFQPLIGWKTYVFLCVSKGSHALNDFSFDLILILGRMNLNEIVHVVISSRQRSSKTDIVSGQVLGHRGLHDEFRPTTSLFIFNDISFGCELLGYLLLNSYCSHCILFARSSTVGINSGSSVER